MGEAQEKFVKILNKIFEVDILLQVNGFPCQLLHRLLLPEK